jgi:hypothetical protein
VTARPARWGPRARLCSLLSLALLAGLACRQHDSLVFVSVTTEPSVGALMQLRVEASNASNKDVRYYPAMAPPTPIVFPASFSLLLPASRKGMLDLQVDGLNGAAQVVAAARASVDIVAGGRADVPVLLQPRASPPPADAGSDAAPDGRPDAAVFIDASTVCDGGRDDCPGGYACTTHFCVAPGLVLYWKLDDTGDIAIDSTGRAHNGTYTGDGGKPTSSTDVPPLGFANPASRTFQAASRQAISMGELPAELRPANNFTVSLFYRATRVGVSGSELLSAGDQYVLRLRPTIFEFSKRVTMGSGPTWANCPGTSANFLDGRWHHLAAVSTTSGVTVYFDGIARCELPVGQDVLYDKASVLWAGRHGNGSANFDFEGGLDEIRVYNRALSPAEIAHLAAGGN